ncbi:hypothetical protein ABZS86_05460 [Streptomyces sp. NPDC005355]|uniref:hypothetical protein n=1 Tax=Streptomyces sp. NPDC005355 TaxID=3157038 RepID=UPI0033AC9DDD
MDIDEYVPLTIQWPRYATLQQVPTCLMLVAGGSLVEVKFDAEDGEIVEVILVDVRGVEQIDSPVLGPAVIEEGIPMIGIVHSVEGEAAGGVQIHENGLDVRFMEGEIARSVGTGGVVLGFSTQGELLGVRVKLGPSDVFQLHEVLH